MFVYPVGESVVGTGIVEGTVAICSKDTRVPPVSLVMSCPHIHAKEIIREVHQDVFASSFFMSC